MSGPDKADYPKDPYLICKDSTVLSCGRMPKVVDVKCEHVGACIVVHGVNDVGTAYPAVEDGLMAGLAERMKWLPGTPLHLRPYRLPGDDDARRLEDDPDAVFYKRNISPDTCSPVIPFYWGYRGTPKAAPAQERSAHRRLRQPPRQRPQQGRRPLRQRHQQPPRHVEPGCLGAWRRGGCRCQDPTGRCWPARAGCTSCWPPSAWRPWCR
jgi:hypothetical protein